MRDSPDRLVRRTFLKLAGASAALPFLTACVRRAERVVPYARRPAEVTPGIPTFYATALVEDGHATGVLVETHEGRPTKVEGNPDHPASLGGTSARDQAAVLSLYDPCRAQAIRRGREPRSWTSFVALARELRGTKGRGLRLLLEPTASPLTASLVARLQAELPLARVHFHAPLAAAGPVAAAHALWGRPLVPIPDLEKASVVLAVDADFLSSGPFRLRHARQLARRRRASIDGPGEHRLYVVEPALTPTGAAADRRLARRASEATRFLASLVAELVLGLGRAAEGMPAGWLGPLAGLRERAPDLAFVRELARDLVRIPGEGLVLVGARQPAEAHALAALANLVLGSEALEHREPTLLGTDPDEGLEPLVAAIDRGEVETLAILDANPVYSQPPDVDLANRLGSVPTTIRLGLYEDETARACRWSLPMAHALESWGEARAQDGTATVVQPVVRPLWGGKTVDQVLAALATGADRDALELVRERWEREAVGSPEAFRRALERGVVEGSASPVARPRVQWESARALVEAAGASVPAAGLEVAFAPDAAVHDGRYGNNPWLQELPDPITSLAWDKAALLGPETAKRHGLETGHVARLSLAGRSLDAPVLVAPGHVEGAVTLPLGYGRQGAEAVARGLGFSAYGLRMRWAQGFAGGLEVRALRRRNPGSPLVEEPVRHPLARTQAHDQLEGRPLALALTVDEARARGRRTPRPDPAAPSLYAPRPRAEGPQWGMAIDLSACFGCNACVVACDAENNVPTVGKEGVLAGRAMHWLRIDRSVAGPPAEPSVVFEPMLCQHCEKAPCEYVCPVNATTHSPDGLNEQTYNRCIGTRFCSNNCPYKVRRFNWFDYTSAQSAVEQLARNPDVTVRERGVIEKCTFCVQRIREAGIRARREGREVREGEVVTACQQACPARAIRFGSIADPGSEVSREHRDPRAYSVLEELGTRPRVRYLARITNPPIASPPPPARPA